MDICLSCLLHDCQGIVRSWQGQMGQKLAGALSNGHAHEERRDGRIWEHRIVLVVYEPT
jgi:hypothetical protein